VPSVQDHLKQLIREVPDFPKPGTNFYDITTLLKDKDGIPRNRGVPTPSFVLPVGEGIEQAVAIPIRVRALGAIKITSPCNRISCALARYRV